MARHLVVGILGLCGALASFAPVRAQAVLDDLYGQGVHAYFDGDLQGAVTWLSEAIDQGTRDPRAYYFRGVAQLRLGDAAAAADDFRIGATIENDGSDQYFPIASSLSRIQGEARMQIEHARQAARKEARDRIVALERGRYEATVAAEARVLRGAGDQAIQLQSSPEVAAGFQLPFPNESVGASLPFMITEMSASAERISSGVTQREVAPAIVDPVLPAPTTDPAVEAPVNQEAVQGNGEASSSNVLRGLFRAFSSQVPDPSAALQAIPGGVPGIPGGNAAPTNPNFDPNQPQTQPGQNPFGPGN